MTTNVQNLLVANVLKSMQPKKKGKRMKGNMPMKVVPFKEDVLPFDCMSFYASVGATASRLEGFLCCATDYHSRWYSIRARTFGGQPLEDALGDLRGVEENFTCKAVRLEIGDAIIITDKAGKSIVVDYNSIQYPWTIEEKDDYLNWGENGFKEDSKSMLYFGIDPYAKEEGFEPELRFDPNDIACVGDIYLQRIEIMGVQQGVEVLNYWFKVQLRDKNPEDYHSPCLIVMYNPDTKDMTFVRKPVKWDDFRDTDLKAVVDNGVYESLANASWLRMWIESAVLDLAERLEAAYYSDDETYFKGEEIDKRKDENRDLVLTKEEEYYRGVYKMYWKYRDAMVNITDMEHFKGYWEEWYDFRHGDMRKKSPEDYRHNMLFDRWLTLREKIWKAAIPAHASTHSAFDDGEYTALAVELKRRLCVALSGKEDFDVLRTSSNIYWTEDDEIAFDLACVRAIEFTTLPDKELFKLIWSIE